VSAVKRVEFFSNRMSYIVLRGRWYSIIVLTVHAPTEEKSDDSSVTLVTTYLRRITSGENVDFSVGHYPAAICAL
jgi:hypothetical protein